MAPKKNLAEHYDDGTLDLSLSGLQDVPVRDIVAIPKAVRLDLSSNIIVSLPKTFASSLTRLVQLDLSKNQISSLPDNFGLLVNLKHLDLDNNKLESLPLSFGNLKSLRWLDLKMNPLMPKLAEIAGHCLDAAQCQAAARNVVAALRAMQEQVDAEITRRKEKHIKKMEQIEENLKKQNKENPPSKKKKKKAASILGDNGNLTQANGQTQAENDGYKNNINEESSNSVPVFDERKTTVKPGLLKKAIHLLSTTVKFVMMTMLLAVSLGFLLSIIDPNLYTSLQLRVTQAIQSNVPKHYLKYLDSGVLVMRRRMTSWSTQIVNISEYSFNKIQEYFAAVSSSEVVQQYLESIKSGWHILWIYISETYVTLSVQIPRYISSVKEIVFGSSSIKS